MRQSAGHRGANQSGAVKPALGIALMAAASLVIPIVDGIAKFLASEHSPYFIAWARYVTASCIVVPIALAWNRGSRAVRTDFASNALRTTLIVGAMTCFFFAITDIPLATAFGGFFLGPVIAAVLGACVLGEKITPWRAIAIAAGLAGAFLIIRPGPDLELGSLLASLSGALFAGYLVATRVTASATPPLDALRFQCVFGTLLLTPFAAWHWSWPSAQGLALILAMGAISAICYFMVIAAFRHAEAAVLAPLVYLELVTAVVLGQLIFLETPDGLASIGIALIVLAGLVISVSVRNPQAGQPPSPSPLS